MKNDGLRTSFLSAVHNPYFLTLPILLRLRTDDGLRPSYFTTLLSRSDCAHPSFFHTSFSGWDCGRSGVLRPSFSSLFSQFFLAYILHSVLDVTMLLEQ